MFSFPASCPGERAVIVLFAHWDESSGGWAGCDFNQVHFYLCVINMHGKAKGEGGWGWWGGEEMSWEKMNESN